MERSEQTTDEIIQSMRRCGYYLVNGCDGCRYNPIGTTQECTMKTMHIAADLLESQRREIVRLKLDLEQARLSNDILCGALKDAEDARMQSFSKFVISEPSISISVLTAERDAEKARADAAERNLRDLQNDIAFDLGAN